MNSLLKRPLAGLFCIVAIVLCGHSKVTPHAAVSSPAPAMPLTNSLDQAAAQNARLRHQLAWAFGGKQQRGWNLYVPLIARLLGANCAPDGAEFARALHNWQHSAGLIPNGVLDRETWLAMVAIFQAQRLKERATPSAERLVQAPANDFYDQSRADELRYIDRAAYAAYQRLLAAARAELGAQLERGSPEVGAFLKIISAYRSPAYQAQLRRLSPQSGRAGLAVNSPHFTGRALDLYVGGDPVSTADHNRHLQINTPVYQWLVKNAARFGFYPYFYEPWHWEYRG